MAAHAEAAGDKEVAARSREIAAEEAKHHQDFQAAVSKSLKPSWNEIHDGIKGRQLSLLE